MTKMQRATASTQRQFASRTFLNVAICCQDSGGGKFLITVVASTVCDDVAIEGDVAAVNMSTSYIVAQIQRPVTGT